MKRLFIIAALAFGVVSYGQTTGDKIEKTQVTKTTVNNGATSDTRTKKVTTTSEREIALNPADEGQVNQSLASDMKTRTNVTYSGDDNTNYRLKAEKSGYSVMRMNGKDSKNQAKMRKLSSGYMYQDSKGTSYAHFDKNGNLIVETYNKNNDTIEMRTYKVQPDNQ